MSFNYKMRLILEKPSASCKKRHSKKAREYILNRKGVF